MKFAFPADHLVYFRDASLENSPTFSVWRFSLPREAWAINPGVGNYFRLFFSFAKSSLRRRALFELESFRRTNLCRVRFIRCWNLLTFSFSFGLKRLVFNTCPNTLANAMRVSGVETLKCYASVCLTFCFGGTLCSQSSSHGIIICHSKFFVSLKSNYVGNMHMVRKG